LVVCSPNYLHSSHCLMGMRSGANVICEKPLVLREANLDNLAEWEHKTGKKINVILQCRLHPDVQKARKWLIKKKKTYIVDIDYNAPRGAWYEYSWKGNEEKSGGIMFNIGIHLFDLICWLFDGDQIIHSLAINRRSAFGRFLLSPRIDVAWQLSTDRLEPIRRFTITEGFHPDNKSFALDLTDGMESLHHKSYRNICSYGCGWRIDDIRPATRLVESMVKRGWRHAD